MSRRTCPHCHKLVRGPVKFCPHCGVQLPAGGPAPWPVWPFVAGAVLVAALIGGFLLVRAGNRPGGQPPTRQPSAAAGAGSATVPATLPPTAAEPTPPVEPTAAPAPTMSTQVPATAEATPIPATTEQIDITDTIAALATTEQAGVVVATVEQASTAFTATMTEQVAIPTPSPAPPSPPPPVPTRRPQPTAVPIPPLFMAVQKTGEGSNPRCINVRVFLPSGYPVTTSDWRLVADGLGASDAFNSGGYAGVCVANERQEFKFTILTANGVRILSGNRGVPARGGDIFEAYTQQ